ncbi:unnamed protein product [Cyprideis torosa]|uniref:PiggyBac transposable element-derived protein domain-containing protein n=1 Tax=Cyprideis torosa TaxID=163714 RepID=A0A7R8WG80_9CRUS|nr:unnamed protein product [Cyprideis torosa]CAG0892316.1 unnamed protein product [Cyprideis torosa]
MRRYAERRGNQSFVLSSKDELNTFIGILLLSGYSPRPSRRLYTGRFPTLPRHLQLLYHVFIDNLFTGLPLLKALSDRGFQATGTIRQNRVPKDCPIKRVDAMKKGSRGTMDAVSDKVNGLTLIRWKNNSVVTTASTSAGTQPQNMATRMDGRHRQDGPKHWGLPDRGQEQEVVVNAWLLFRANGHPGISQLDFIRTVSRVYIAQSWSKPPGSASASAGAAAAKARARNANVLSDVGLDRLDHLVEQRGNQGTCAVTHHARVAH